MTPLPHEHTWTLLASELPKDQTALHIYVRWCHGCNVIETLVDGDTNSDEGWLPTTPTYRVLKNSILDVLWLAVDPILILG